MAKGQSQDSKLIDALGGPSAVSRMCGIDRAAVCQWRKKGIPELRRLQIATILKKSGKETPSQLRGLAA
jgi:hypothetical protein